MNLIRNKYFIAALITAAVLAVWQGFRVQRAKEAAALLGMMDYDYSQSPVDPDDGTNWDGYETGSGVPPWEH